MRMSDWSSDVCSSDLETFHYSISIIRGRGIDDNALDYVASRHGTKNAVFVDGWPGKGAIRGELDASLATSTFKPVLADVAAPDSPVDLPSTFDDYVLPSGQPNYIISVLRTPSYHKN